MLRCPQISSKVPNFAKNFPGGSAPLAPRRGSAPGPRWGLRPQTPTARASRGARCARQTTNHRPLPTPGSTNLEGNFATGATAGFPTPKQT